MNAMTDESMNAAPAPGPNRVRKPRRFWRLFWSIVLGLLAALALLLWWVLLSSSGARFALGFVPGLQVQTVSGHLVGPLTLDGVVYDSPLAALRAQRIEADVRLWPLLSGAVQLDLLRTRSFALTLKPSTEVIADPPPSGPLELPSVRVEQIDLLDTQLLGMAEAPIVIQQLSGAVATGAGGVELRELRARLPQGEVWANGTADPGKWLAQLQTRFTPTAGPAELAVMQLDLSSDGSKAVVALDIAGEATRLNVDIEQLQGDPRYSASVLSPGLDLARLGLPAGTQLPPVELRINGDAGSATLDGQITLAAQIWRLDGTRLAWNAERITLDPLRIQPASGGEIRAQGTVGVKDQAALLQINAQSVSLSSLAGQPDTDPASSLDLVAAALELQGSLLDWQLSGTAHLLRDNNDLRLSMDLAGDAQTLSVRQLRLLGSAGETALGELDVSGELGLAPPYVLGLAVKADSFDTAALLPGWPGELSMLAQVSGAVEQQVDVSIEQIGGSLRAAPISGSGDLRYDPTATWPSGTLKLSWGGNSVDLDAAVGAPLVLDFELQQPALLDPQLSGSLSGSARLATDATRLEIDAKGSALAYGDQQLDALRLRADVGLDSAAPLTIELGIDDLSSAGAQQLQSLLLSSSGTVGAHQLQLRALSPQGAVALNAAGGWDGAQWRGMLNSLALNPGEGVPEELRGKALSLQAPVNVSLSAQRSELGQACLALDQARVCLGGTYASGAASQIDFNLSQLPLELARPWLEPAGLVFEGALDGEGQLNFTADGTPSGAIAVRGSDVELLLLSTELPKRFKFERFDIRIEPATVAALAVAATAPTAGAAEAESALATPAAPNNLPALQASVDLQIAKLGTLRLRSDLQGNTGLLEVDFDSLEALDDLSPDLVKPRGQLRGALRSNGGALSGQIELSQFSAELPAANLRISDGSLKLSGAPDRILIEGVFGSGEGQLQLGGEFRPEAGMAGLDLDITGENFLAADLPQVRLLISPALKLRGADGQLRITGDLAIPQGRVDLARFEPAISASADVVYVDAPPPEDAAGVPLFADINISFGDAVELRGFGLDGRIAGRLAVRERPGRPTTARGEITVSGTYKAYGQDLTIERGKLLFANSGLDNPGLDIRAARTIGQIKAGVQVRGSADAPELTTYSSPAMDQLNTISYLVLGRPASQAGDGAGGQAMQNAAQQLGGNLLAKSIGQKLGLEVGIESSAALGGASAFSVGKYLSPRLFVGYGRSLYEELQLFIVRYKLREHYEVEATSGREQKIGVNYRRER